MNIITNYKNVYYTFWIPLSIDDDREIKKLCDDRVVLISRAHNALENNKMHFNATYIDKQNYLYSKRINIQLCDEE